jgi:hypothetical protein
LGVFMAWGDESFSPYDKRFNKLAVTRIGVDPNYFEQTIKRIALGGRDTKFTYVSDGNASVITTGKDREKYVNMAALGGMRVSYYEVSVPKTKQKSTKKIVSKQNNKPKI